ncbi:unnamed protein product [Lepidochelys kempii]
MYCDLGDRHPAGVADNSEHRWKRRECQECQPKKRKEDMSLKIEEKKRDSGHSNLPVNRPQVIPDLISSYC